MKMKKYSIAEPISEFRELSDDDKKSAFQYAYIKKFKYLRTYLWFIPPLALSVISSELLDNQVFQCIVTGFAFWFGMMLMDYMTMPIFKKHLLEYIHIMKSSQSRGFEEIIGTPAASQSALDTCYDKNK